MSQRPRGEILEKVIKRSATSKSMHRKFGRSWINLEMQTTWLNTYLPNFIATILKALREQFKEHDQLNAVEVIAGPVLEIFVEYDQILKEEGKFWDVNGGYLFEDLVLGARREEIDWVHILKVSTRLFQCKSAETQTSCGSDTQESSIEVVCKRIQNEEANCSMHCHFSKL